MGRFICLGNQTSNVDYDAGEREFAFYCTNMDVFEVFSGKQTWTTRQEFISDYDGSDLQRYLRLIPSDWP